MSHIWMSHVTHMDESCHTHGWVMSHIWMSHVTHTDESCHTHGWVMSHIWMSHVTHMDESCHTYGGVMSHIWMSPVTHMDESCHTYGWVMSHIWMSHVTHMDESCHTYGWVMSQIYMSHVTHMNKSCCAYESVSNLCHDTICHDTHMKLIGIRNMCVMTYESCCAYKVPCDTMLSMTCLWHDSFMSRTWLIHVYDMTHPYVMTHISNWLVCATWHMKCNMSWHMTHVAHTKCPVIPCCLWHDSFMSMIWLIHMSWHTHETDWYAQHDIWSAICHDIWLMLFIPWLICHDIWLIWLIWVMSWHMTHMSHVMTYESCCACQSVSCVCHDIWMSHIIDMNESCRI